MPKPAADVFAVLARRWAPTTHEDDPSKDEHDRYQELENALHIRQLRATDATYAPELFLCVAERAEDVDEDERDPEDGDPDGDRDGCSALPILYGDACESQSSQRWARTCRRNLERKRSEPLEVVAGGSEQSESFAHFQPIAKANLERSAGQADEATHEGSSKCTKPVAKMTPEPKYLANR